MITRKLLRLIIGTGLLTTGLFLLEVRADEPAKSAKSASKPVDYNLKLSHKTHIEFVEKCKDCKKDCTDCHILDQKTDAYTVDQKFCDKCHVNSPPNPWKIPVTARKLKLKKVVFKHTEHERSKAGRELKCVDCHKTTMRDRQRQNTPHVAAKRCFSCHEKDKVKLPERKCVKCHDQKDIRKVKPTDHQKSWTLRHGRTAEWQTNAEHGQNCTLCHTRTGCKTCHLNTKPRDHTGLWRVRMHGTAATWNRHRCKTCHTTGACKSCHQTTAPQSHRGAWKAIHGISAKTKRNGNCGACHHKAWCTACHAGNQ
jgi:hypothetical protein